MATCCLNSEIGQSTKLDKDFCELSSDGPLGKSMWALRDKQISLFFLLAKETDYCFTHHVHAMVKFLRDATAYKIFSFSDGAILAVSVNEPPKITIHRCYKTLSNFSDFVFMTADGETYSGNRETWRQVKPGASVLDAIDEDP